MCICSLSVSLLTSWPDSERGGVQWTSSKCSTSLWFIDSDRRRRTYEIRTSTTDRWQAPAPSTDLTIAIVAVVFLSCGKSTFPRHAPAVRDFMRFDIYWKVSQNVDQASVRYFPIPDWHRHNSGDIIIYSRVAEEKAVGCPLYRQSQGCDPGLSLYLSLWMSGDVLVQRQCNCYLVRSRWGWDFSSSQQESHTRSVNHL